MSSQVLFSNAFGKITKEIINDEIEVIAIEHQSGKASVSLYGGHVLDWQPEGHQPVFWLSRTTAYQSGKAIRGGIPICWPWFGPNLDTNGVNGGNHGFARNNHWQLVDYKIAEHEVKLVLEFTGEGKHQLWPESFILRQELTIGDVFTQRMSMTNLSSKSVEYSSALHSYFAVSHPQYTHVNNLSEALFDDKITQNKAQKDKLVNCVGPIDRIYYSSTEQEIIDDKWQRKVVINSKNCQQWVLWNPGVEIAAGMDDIHPEGEDEYVCLEAANTQWQTIEAGQTVSVEQKVTVSNL